MAEVITWVIGLTVLVGLPGGLLIAYLVGRIRYDGKGPGNAGRRGPASGGI
jgi:hypothetical protein